MKIVFNLHNVGLGNNGGSRTIIKCADTLTALGHKVILFTNQQVKFTWEKIHSKLMYGNTHPVCDVSIATGFKSIATTLSCRASKKYCYVRGLEKWVTNERELFRNYKKINCIVNSIWLKDYFYKNGVESKIIYPGLDFDKFYLTNNEYRVKNVGALYSDRHATKRHNDAKDVSKRMSIDVLFLNKNIVNASEKRLRQWYNQIKIWFSPSELEGLHNPPMEAGLCGCSLVCTDHYMSGVSDYAIHNKTALIYPARKLSIARKHINTLMNDEELRKELNFNLINLLKKKIRSRKENMIDLIRYIEGK